MKHRTPRKRLLNRTLVSVAVASCFATSAALANPTAPTVVHGSAAFQQHGSLLKITNSPNAIINWGSFSIGAGEITRFIQQSAASVVLNRVVGQDPSSILGALQSNGRVFLINPNGILFGAGAQVDVAGLVASTLNLSNADFLAGRLNFTEVPGAGSIVNQGGISTPSGGSVYLVAPDITNSGIITSPQGEVILAAGKSVELVNPGTPNLRVEINAPDNAARNLGEIAAESGRIGIYAGLINHSGTIRADSAEVTETGRIVLKATRGTTLEADSLTSANGSSGGKIEIQSGDTTFVAGTIEARGTSSSSAPGEASPSGDASEGKGGTVHILGSKVGLIDSARIDASGETGGGTVLVGGGLQGEPAPSAVEGSFIQNAHRTYFGHDARISVDAIAEGDGGKAIVWSDDATRAYGTITARGGVQSGDGGFVEISGKNWLDFGANVDTRAPNGATGSLLLDPTNVFIALNLSNAVTAGMVGSDTSIDLSGLSLFESSGVITDSLLRTGTLTSALGSNNVTVSTANPLGLGAGNIRVVDPISWSSDKSLTLLANSNVTTSAAIANAGTGGMRIFAGWDGASTGTPTVNAGTGSITLNAPITLSATVGELSLVAGNMITQSAGAVLTVNGLNARAGESVLLNQADNAVNIIAGIVDDCCETEFRFKNTQPLTIGSVAGTDGIFATDNDGNPTIDVNVTSGGLTISKPVTVESGGSILLSAAGAVNVNSDVKALPSSGPVQITGGAITVASGVTVSASGGSGNATVQLTSTAGNIAVQNGASITATTSFGASSVTLGATGGSISLDGATLSAIGGDTSFGAGGAATLSVSSSSGVSTNSANPTSLTATGGNTTDTMQGGGGADILVQSGGAIDLTGSSLAAMGGTGIFTGTATATLKVSSTLGNVSPSGDIIAHNITAANIELQQNSVAEKGIKRASATSLLDGTQLLLEVDRPDDLGFSGSIGTSAEPIRVNVSRVESHTHEATAAGGGIFIESPNAGNLQIGGVSFFGGSVKGVQNVSGGDISIAVNGALTLQSGSAPSPSPCGLGATGGPVCTSSGDIALQADDIAISNVVRAIGGTATLEPFSSTRDILVHSSAPFAGVLNLSPAVLQNITASNIDIGRSTNTGTLTLATPLISTDIDAGTLRLAHQNVVINNAITFNTDNENLALAAGSGSVTIGADLNVGSGTINAATSTVNVSGTRVVTGSSFSAGTLTVDTTDNVSLNATSNINTLNVSAGTFQGTGDVTVNNAFNWSGTSTIAGAGAFNTAATATGSIFGNGLSKTLSSRTWNNSGTVTWSSGRVFLNGASAAINNESGGLFISTVTSSPLSDFMFFSGTSGTFNNQAGATFRKSSGPTGGSIITNFINDGLLDLDVTQAFTGSTLTNTGTIDMAPGAAMRISGATANINAGTTLTGTGIFLIESGSTVNVNAPLVIPATVTFNLQGGTLQGTGDVTVNGPMADWNFATVQGSGEFNTHGVSTLTGSSQPLGGSRVWNNFGTVNKSGPSSIALSGTAVLNNESGGVINWNGNSSIIFSSGTPLLTNSGTINVVSGVTLSLSGAVINFPTNDGVINLPGGTFSTGGNPLANSASGVISGTGTLDLFGATLTNNGTIRPAGTGATGTLSIAGDLTQGAGGQVDIELAGSGAGQFDVLAVSGAANLGGTLNVSYLTGYAPSTGETHDVLTYASLIGTFGAINDAQSLIANYGATAFQLIAPLLVAWDGGGGDGFWTTAQNWNNDTVPTSTTPVQIPELVGSQTITIASGNQAAKSVVIVGDETLALTGGSLTVTDPSTVNGTISIGGGSLLGAASWTVNNITLSSGTLGVTGAIAVNGAFNWTGGIHSGLGTTTIAAGALAISGAGTKTLSQRTLANQSAASTWTGAGALLINDGAVFNNAGTLTVTGTTSLGENSGFGGTFNNAGTLIRQGVGTTTTLGNTNNEFNNTGLVDVLEGTLVMQTAGTLGGTLNVAGGATAEISAGTLSFDAINVNSTGVFRISGGTHPINVGQTLTVQNLELTGGTLGGAGNLTVNGTFDWTGGTHSGAGTTTVAGGGVLAISGAGTKTLSQRTLANQSAASTWTGTGTLLINDSAVFNNAGTLTVTGTTSLGENSGFGGTFNNAGTLIRQGVGTTTTLGNTNNDFNNTGLVDVLEGTLDMSAALAQSGALNVAAAATFRKSAGFTNAGVITGGGAIDVATATLLNDGTLAPDGSTGVLTINGNYAQGATGVLAMEFIGPIPGTQHDQLVVTGSAALGGTLNLTELAGSTVVAGDSLTMLTCGAVCSGTFSAIVAPNITLTPTYGSTSVALGISALINAWIAGGSGAWEVAANWSRGTVPAAGHDVTIDVVGSTETITVGSGAQNARAVTSNENLTVSGGSLTLTSASTINATLSVAGGTVNVDGGLAASSLNLSSGTLQGLGDITVSGPFTWSGGTIAGNGANSFTSSGASSLNGATKTLMSRTWNNAGTATWTGGSINLSDAGAVVNNQGTFTANLGTFFDDFLGVGTFNNLGGAVFNSNAGGFDVSFNGPGASNDGLINVTNGRLNFVQGFANTGTINLTAPGAVFEAFTGSTVDLNAGTSITGTGEVRVANGTLNVNTPLTLPGTVTLSLLGGTFNSNAATTVDAMTMSAGTLGGAGTLTVNGALDWSGGAMSGGGTMVAMSGVNFIGNTTRTLGSRTLTLNAATALAAGETLNIAGGAIGGSGTFANLGTINASGSSSIDNSFTSGGQINVNSGTLNLGNFPVNDGTIVIASGAVLDTGGQNLTNSAGALISGNGTLKTGVAALANNGTVAPGASTGVLTVDGNYTQGATGVLGIEVAGSTPGTQHDQLVVTGNAVLGGTLNVTELAGSALTGGDSVAVLSCASCSGAFSTINAPGISLTPIYGPITVALDINALINGWVGGGSGAWETASNWSRGVVPTISDDVVIDVTGSTETITVNAGAQGARSITTNENLSLAGGSLALSSASTVNGDFTLSGGGVLQGAGTLTVNGSLNWSSGTMTGGGTTVAANGVNFLGAGTRTLSNRTLTLNAPTMLAAGETLSVSDSIINGGASFGNLGTISTSGTSSVLNTLTNGGGINVNSGILTLGGFPVNAGTITIASGAVLDTNGNGFTNLAGGLVQGGGTLRSGTATFFNDGAVAPGASPGILSVDGNYVQGPTGVLVADIGGTTAGTLYDQLFVTGNVALDGTLSANLFGGFVPAAGDTFNLVQAGGAITGNFASTNLPVVSGVQLTTASLASAVNLVASGSAPAASTLPPPPQISELQWIEQMEDPEAVVRTLASALIEGAGEEPDGEQALALQLCR